MFKTVFNLMKVLAIAAAVLLCQLTTRAQSGNGEFQKLLRSQATFEDGDLAALERGEPVVRSIESEVKREVTVCGVIKLRGVREMSLKSFIEKMSQQDDKTVLSWGRFSIPPVYEDLQRLTLENADIDDMRTCAVGDCDLKMSAAMITRLRHDVDWNAPESPAAATKLFGKMLTEYLIDYMERGDKALLQYDNRKQPVRLEDDHRMLLEGVPFLDEMAPRFGQYLKNFPSAELPGVEHELDWTMVDFGLKPILTLTHTASYAVPNNDPVQFVIATKGIYATRYLDSSLALVMLIRDSTNGAGSYYLIFTNISRSNSLGGLFSGLKRSVVANQSEEKVKGMLARSKPLIERRAETPTSESSTEPPSRGVISTIGKYLRKPLVSFTVVLVVGAILFFLYQRARS